MTFSIVLVEDNDVDAMAFTHAAEGAGATVIQCDNTGEAESLCLDRDVDLVVLDLRLVDETGMEFLRKRNGHARLRKTPTVVLSTSNDPRDVALAHNFKSEGYFVKPIEIHELKQLVETIVDYWSQHVKDLNGYEDGAEQGGAGRYPIM